MNCSLAPKASARSPRASHNAVGRADFNKCQATTTLKSNLPSPASEARSPDWEGAPERDPHPESTKPSVSAVCVCGAGELTSAATCLEARIFSPQVL